MMTGSNDRSPLPLYRVTFLHVRNGTKYEVTVRSVSQYRARKDGEAALARHVALTAGHVADWAWYGTAEVQA